MFAENGKENDTKTCKIKPTASECCMCADTADYFNGEPNCRNCRYNTTRYELIGIGSGLFNDYAFVQTNGKIQKVALDRVYDVRGE